MLEAEETKEELSEDGSKIGIESENQEENILEPFDPDSISIESKVIAMDTVIRRLEHKTIQLAPNFQRSEVWDPTRRSRLIESLMLKIPLPMFYVAATEEGAWEVVDGLQRLSTIRNFMLGDKEGKKLKLSNLEFLGNKFNGKTFDDIENDPSQVRLINTIRETEMRFTVINPSTPEEVKRNIFKRINTGGLPLTGQEIRHALYQGNSSDLLIKLVELTEFKNAINKKINDTRMGARELVLRFLAFLIIPVDEYQSDMDRFLSNAMRIINCMPELEHKKLLNIYGKEEAIPTINYNNIADIEKMFVQGMLRGHELFGDHAFRTSLPDSPRKSPINKSLFESWSTILCTLSEKEFEMLRSKKKEFFIAYKDQLESDAFSHSISRYATKKTSGVMMRYKVINKIVTDILVENPDDN
ncbi:conserved hypothetical protein [Bathymodiolus platifrons methanotrophic gill symbiont]|uniref:DUF262 domain-containing protein n=1 Tax=Bathymodiolus platifrons methanotrophic gill symbiont TaxID=113268 RepID=UPI000B41F1F3|nr:DUF262 domain-containing protein [Bathymodiolus platifrons methanotrophic gill symbiont]GAW87728.1 conserved hypothetical protein [Bathymodiolus platifrons methanotrophic gill symbiont]